ncbi:hypothetical protein F4806DRAFT_7384 [Annulohypoxylon nitens]|nr:hypothetical protein F4806DRAFT_7384 [Annulohypoxylon nitens]
MKRTTSKSRVKKIPRYRKSTEYERSSLVCRVNSQNGSQRRVVSYAVFASKCPEWPAFRLYNLQFSGQRVFPSYTITLASLFYFVLKCCRVWTLRTLLLVHIHAFRVCPRLACSLTFSTSDEEKIHVNLKSIELQTDGALLGTWDAGFLSVKSLSGLNWTPAMRLHAPALSRSRFASPSPCQK